MYMFGGKVTGIDRGKESEQDVSELCTKGSGVKGGESSFFLKRGGYRPEFAWTSARGQVGARVKFER